MHRRNLEAGAKIIDGSAPKKSAIRSKIVQNENWRSDLPHPISSSEMRALENAVLESGRVSGLELMERAGRGVVETVKRQWPDVTNDATDIVILCGPGNNGGDGFVVARLLAELDFHVRVFFYGKREKLSYDAGKNHDRWAEGNPDAFVTLGFPNLTSKDCADIVNAYGTSKRLVVVDALFGIGLDRAMNTLQPVLDAHASRRSERPAPETLCVAIDVPSGVADDGPVSTQENAVFQSDLTVTFHQIKRAHVAAPAFCGNVVVHDIGL